MILCRGGPTYCSRGTVVLTFEGNGYSKIGVRFDRPVPEGNDLGGLCEEDHGFFCSGNTCPTCFCYLVLFIFRTFNV